jgi:hypothetical protein
MAVNVETGMREIGEIVRGIVEKMPPNAGFKRAFAEGELQNAAIAWSDARAARVSGFEKMNDWFVVVALAEIRLQAAVARFQEAFAGEFGPEEREETTPTA